MNTKKQRDSQIHVTIPDIIPPSNGQPAEGDTILVVTSDASSTRGPGGAQPLEVEKLTVNVNLFVQQMGKVLENTPEKLGKFHFDEFEIHADISADGKITLLGSGIQGGVTGGLKFTFRRSNKGA